MGYESETTKDAVNGPGFPARLREKWRRRPAAMRWGGLGLVALLLWWTIRGLFFGGESVTYRTAAATRGNIERTVTALGSLQPKNYVDVGAQISGQLKFIHVDVGDEVQEGDLLAEIDARTYETDLAAARARLTQLESELAGSQAQLTLARRQYARNLELAKTHAVSRDQFAPS